MQYFSSSKIVFLLACTLSVSQQVQGAQGIPTELDLHQDSCMVGQFGETVDHEALATLVNNAPANKLVDAFIACPDQMATICFERLFINSDDSIIEAVIEDSEKMEAFYNVVNAIRISESAEIFIPDNTRRKAVRQAIYAMSLIHGIPEHLYMASLKAYPDKFISALIDKGALCKTEDEKAAMVALLQEARDWLNEDKNTYLSRLTTYGINLLTGQKIQIEPENHLEKYGVFLMSFAYNRFDVAKAIAASGLPLFTLKQAKYFVCKKHLGQVQDRVRAIETIRNILPEGDRKAFDEHVKSVLPENMYTPAKK